MNNPTLLSGIQPSGKLMIGNYLGVVKQWVTMQDEYNCLFPLVDLHAITVRQDPKLLRQRSYEFLSLYIACGLNPKKSTIFVQSHVPQHAQFSWILNCFTYMGELNRMTQFKDKSQKHASNINAGLYSYPVLMAADILLYQSDLVPVGEDQKQHLELCRNLAQRLNHEYATEEKPLLKMPEPYIPPKTSGGRIMALQDPTVKMSKSDTNEQNVIFLLDDPKTIEKKIKRCVTDSGSEITYDEKTKPGIANLLTIYSLITQQNIDEIVQSYQGKGYGYLKVDLAEALIEHLRPLQEKQKQLISDKAELDKILTRGAKAAQELAQKTLDTIHQKIGFI
jgi:tryptophanyl-tRNA synthetase